MKVPHVIIPGVLTGTVVILNTLPLNPLKGFMSFVGRVMSRPGSQKPAKESSEFPSSSVLHTARPELFCSKVWCMEKRGINGYCVY